MDVPEELESFWAKFLDDTDRDEFTVLYDSFYFGDSEDLATSLAALVLEGRKAGTAGLVWEYEAEGLRLPEAGDLIVITAYSGNPLCVIEVTQSEVRAFNQVEADFAAAEGEGDLTLAWWREAHWSFFGRLCETLNREAAEDMPVICTRFKVIYIGS
ncbi:ASCH domain-containing protein [bacterium AH-315-P07]|nr:ASCH domain-containing protein [bacterium AH-315-P07]